MVLFVMAMKQKNIWINAIAAFLVLQLAFVYACFIEPNWIEIKRVRVNNPKLAYALKDIRLVQLSDLHIANVDCLEISLIEKINRLKPDIILITGDFVDTRKGINSCWDVLRLLKAKFGIYAIYGDMDDYHIADLINDPAWQKSGVTMLNNKAIKLNLTDEKDRVFWLAGLHVNADIKSITERVAPYEPVILMVPDPDSAKEASVSGVDLVMAGDTHGGQVNPRFLRSIIPFAVENRSPYVSGLFKVKNTLLYVNRGIGTSHINARFFCRPEITVFDFVTKGWSAKPKILDQDRVF